MRSRSSSSSSLLLLALTLLLLVGFASSLKCFKSRLMNRLDVTEVIEQEECSDSEVSCEGRAYEAYGMWYIELKGCSTEDRDKCTSEKLGQGDSFQCHCKSDYCNHAAPIAAGSPLAAVVLAAVVAAANSLYL